MIEIANLPSLTVAHPWHEIAVYYELSTSEVWGAGLLKLQYEQLPNFQVLLRFQLAQLQSDLQTNKLTNYLSIK